MRTVRFLIILGIVLFFAFTSCSGPGSPSSTVQPTPSTHQPTIEPEIGPTTSPSNPDMTLPPGQTLSVHFIDVGQGDSTLVDLGETEVLIDGGERNTGLTGYLDSYIDGSLEAMIATHTHADHIGGLIDVLARYQVKEIWLNRDTSTSATFSQFMTSVNSEGAMLDRAERGDTIQVDAILFIVLNPPETLFSDANNNSVVLSLSYGDIDFLFTGDAENEAEADMLVQSFVPVPDVEILKVGHHGSRTASSLRFLDTVKPEVAIYSCGVGNSYGHPHQETSVSLDIIGAEIYGTDVHGTVVVSTDGSVYEIQTEKRASPVKPTGATTTTTASSSVISTFTSTPSPESTMNTNVKITRILYDGIVPRTESDEYVEITNQGSEPVDLKGWILKDISEGYPSLTFPSYILQPGKSIRVYTNESHPEYGGFSFGSGKAVWNNTSPDTAALYDAEGREISRRSY